MIQATPTSPPSAPVSSGAQLPEIVMYSFFPYRLPIVQSMSYGLARALAQHTRVWYVSKAPTYKDALRYPTKVRAWVSAHVEEVPGFGGNLMEVDLPPTPPVNAMPEGAAYDRVSQISDARMSAALGAVLKRANVQDYLWVNLYAPTQFLNVDLHRPPLARIYYTVDAIGEANWTGRHGILAEARQISTSDMGFGTSTRLAAHLREMPVVGRAGGPIPRENAAPVYVLPNAAADDHFLEVDRSLVPADIAKIPRPRLGYIGNIDEARVDYELFEVLAKARPDVSLVLIGPWNGPKQMKEKLASLPNVYFLGPKPQVECPSYLAQFDAALIPFRCNALTAAIYPLKINEYLALGVPILATPFSEDIITFDDIVVVAPRDKWLKVLDGVLEDNTPEASEARKARARTNTWEERAKSFMRYTEPLYASAKPFLNS